MRLQDSGPPSRAGLLGSRAAAFGTELEVVPQKPTSGGSGMPGLQAGAEILSKLLPGISK